MRRLAYVFGGASAAGAACYLVIYLYRWQWQRAILCGVLLVVVEVLLLGAVLLGRLARIERRVEMQLRDAAPHAHPGPHAHPHPHPPDLLARLRQDPAPGAFRWLDEGQGPEQDPGGTRTYVFVPVLMVTGALLSGLAWLVQRIAAVTARPVAERRLAGRLAVLAAPPPGAGLDDLPPPGGPRDRRRTGRLLAVAAVGAALLAGLVVGLAELTQTREGQENAAAATSVLLRVDMRGGDATAERRSLAAHQLWERCRDATSAPLRHAALGPLDDDLYAGVVRPALTDHDRMRLRGCLEDTELDKAHLTVLGIGDTDPDDD
ncbi:hypothetical protein [Streptomyces formicae]|uniref:Uncharacterized protein n=1 Tax=Streptomyces formicae TaxID=1616117 RepID=A0A291Q557_9ACTN|nr:hypothetical protein [Streptomyces formicae]ATL26930.1 hypothetical protein KY5_1912 [Streptomyces formicae]